MDVVLAVYVEIHDKNIIVLLVESRGLNDRLFPVRCFFPYAGMLLLCLAFESAISFVWSTFDDTTPMKPFRMPSLARLVSACLLQMLREIFLTLVGRQGDRDALTDATAALAGARNQSDDDGTALTLKRLRADCRWVVSLLLSQPTGINSERDADVQLLLYR